MEERLTVGRVAGLAGVSVRTLHHYDEIGLVRPSARTAAGYRAYSAGDVERLREVLAYRRLGFGLREIADLVDDPTTDAVARLHRLRGLLLEQRDHAAAMVTAIDRELEARASGIRTTPEEQLKVFGAQLYEAIGSAYPATRRTEPRIAARVWDALGDARTVLNVGAGTGSYEPPDREVTAVEPSAVMRAQRPAGAAPCVAASAESLPFEDRSFDAAMAFSTVHHWHDPIAGLRELRRVARRVVVFTHDASDTGWRHRFWLTRDYLPEVAGLVAGRPSVDRLARAIGARMEPVLIPWDCADGLFEAYWRRPEAYLEEHVRRAVSVWTRVGPEAEQRAVCRLRDDLSSGQWAERNRDLVDLDAASSAFAYSWPEPPCARTPHGSRPAGIRRHRRGGTRPRGALRPPRDGRRCRATRPPSSRPRRPTSADPPHAVTRSAAPGAIGQGMRTGTAGEPIAPKWITGTPQPAPPVTAPAPAMTSTGGHLVGQSATSTWPAEAATFTWSSAIAHGRTGVPSG